MRNFAVICWSGPASFVVEYRLLKISVYVQGRCDSGCFGSSDSLEKGRYFQPPKREVDCRYENSLTGLDRLGRRRVGAVVYLVSFIPIYWAANRAFLCTHGSVSVRVLLVYFAPFQYAYGGCPPGVRHAVEKYFVFLNKL